MSEHRSVGARVTDAGPEDRVRVVGLDLARFAAIAGMVVVHAAELTTLPTSSGTQGAAADAPAVVEWVRAAATNRARLLFFLLAGVSLSLLADRGRAGTGVLLRRAGFLTALGGLLVLLGWDDVVLSFYGVLFVLAPLLLRLATPALLAVAVLCAVPAVLLFARDPEREAGLTGAALVVGEVLPLFALGLAVGRLPLLADATARRLALLGAALAAPGLVVLAAAGGLDVTEVDGPVELVSALTSTAGLALLVLGRCLALGRRTRAARWLLPAAAAGGMPLTLYAGHALLFPVIARAAELTEVESTAVALGYLIAGTAFAVTWRRRHGSGPVETAMRWTTRT
jgi:uncharacterized membrane protein YeiB